MQKSDWTQSPLSPRQLEYAAEDVAWLPELREGLIDQAKEKQVLAWIEEENQHWDVYQPEAKPNGQPYKKDDAKKLPDFQLYVYNSLLQVRDKYAEELNKPGYQVVDKHLLMDIVFHPEILDEWHQKKGLHPRVRNQGFAEELKSALEKSSSEAEDKKLLKYKPSSRVSFEERERLKKEKDLLKDQAEAEWKGLRDYICEKLGEDALAYIFPEKTLLALSAGEMQIEDIPFAYRKQLLLSQKAN